MTSLSAASLLVFCLLYTPCVAAIASIKRELGGKWALTVVILQCVVAWIAAYIVYLIGGFFFKIYFGPAYRIISFTAQKSSRSAGSIYRACSRVAAFYMHIYVFPGL